jgi:hypothetical protein
MSAANKIFHYLLYDNEELCVSCRSVPCRLGRPRTYVTHRTGNAHFQNFLAQKISCAAPTCCCTKISLFFVHPNSVRFTTQSNFQRITQVKKKSWKVMLSFIDFLRISIHFRIFDRKLVFLNLFLTITCFFENFRC